MTKKEFEDWIEGRIDYLLERIGVLIAGFFSLFFGLCELLNTVDPGNSGDEGLAWWAAMWLGPWAVYLIVRLLKGFVLWINSWFLLKRFGQTRDLREAHNARK